MYRLCQCSVLMLCCCWYIGDSEWFGTRPSDLSRHLNWLVGYMGCTDTQPVGQKIEVDLSWIFLVIGPDPKLWSHVMCYVLAQPWWSQLAQLSISDRSKSQLWWSQPAQLSISDQSESWSVKPHQQYYTTWPGVSQPSLCNSRHDIAWPYFVGSWFVQT